MSHSFTNSLFHCIFSTKNRKPFITDELQSKLWPYMGGIARENRMTAIAVVGVEDHAHILLAIPSTMAIAKAVQLIKGGSSKWVHDTFPKIHRFEWQEGYGAFSIGVSQVETTVKYIAGQREHHQKKSFQDEFLEILKRHKINYDPRYIWG